jgi:peptide/nickel transport system substrate-binding protein
LCIPADDPQVDPVTWRFVLRPGVTFHDGTPLTPAAVVTSLSYVAGVQAPPRALKGIGLTVTEDGPNAVRVATASPDPILPLRMSSPNAVILASSAYAGGAPGVIGTGTGPMRLTATEGVQRAVLERFDGYWGGRASLARVTATFVGDPAARALALRAGDVDIALGLPESSLLEFSADSGFAEQTVAAPRTVSLLMNQSAAPFSDLRIRQAVARAIDRTALAGQALAGSALPASEVFGPAVAWGAQGPAPAPDVEGARALLAQAGHGPDNPLQVRLWAIPTRPELPTLATAVQGMLCDVGIDAQIEIGEYETQEPELLAGRYDMYLLSRNYLIDVPDAAGALQSDFTCDGSYNLNHYCSPAFDALIATLGTTTDVAARQDVFRRAAQMPDGVVLWRHGARLALTAVISLSGMFFAGLLSGAVVVEVVFAVPGLGRLLYDSVIGQDLPMLQAGLLAVVVVAVLASVAAEALQLALDPVARTSVQA